jgi:hypothetical protein
MPFTAVDADTSWQDLALAAELRVAYNHRRAACGLSTLAAPTQDTRVFDFILSLQQGIEAMAASFADPAAALDGESAFPAPYASASAALTAAGLTASGYWRRIAEGGSQPASWTSYGASGWSYGQITSKDLAGPWLYIDLQTALAHLTRRVIPHVFSPSSHTEDVYYLYEPSSLYDIPQTSGPAVGYTSSISAEMWMRRAIREVNTTPDPDRYYLYYQEYRRTDARTLSGLPEVSKTVRLLILPTEPSGATVFDDFGAGWTAGETAVYQTWTADASAAYTWDTPTLPTWSALFSQSGDFNQGFDIAAPCWVIDYLFSP